MIEKASLTFAAHSCHEASLVATVLAANTALFHYITVSTTLASEGWFSIFCTSNVETLKNKIVAIQNFEKTATDPGP